MKVRTRGLKLIKLQLWARSLSDSELKTELEVLQQKCKGPFRFTLARHLLAVVEAEEKRRDKAK